MKKLRYKLAVLRANLVAMICHPMGMMLAVFGLMIGLALLLTLGAAQRDKKIAGIIQIFRGATKYQYQYIARTGENAGKMQEIDLDYSPNMEVIYDVPPGEDMWIVYDFVPTEGRTNFRFHVHKLDDASVARSLPADDSARSTPLFN